MKTLDSTIFFSNAANNIIPTSTNQGDGSTSITGYELSSSYSYDDTGTSIIE